MPVNGSQKGCGDKTLPEDVPSEVKTLLYAVEDLELRENLYWSWVERASICEFEALMPRERAEREALEELRAKVERGG